MCRKKEAFHKELQNIIVNGLRLILGIQNIINKRSLHANFAIRQNYNTPFIEAFN